MADFFFGLPVLVQAVLKGMAVIIVIFPVAAACSMAERKVCAWIQGRPGPNRTIFPHFAWIPGMGVLQRLGLFQLAADGLKFLFKEEPLPGHVNKLYYTLAPFIAMVPAFTTVTVVPFGAYLGSGGSVVPLRVNECKFRMIPPADAFRSEEPNRAAGIAIHPYDRIAGEAIAGGQ